MRNKTGFIDHTCTPSCTETPTRTLGTNAENAEFRFGNSQLLMDYRDTLIKAFELGNDIKTVYGIVPPNVLFDRYSKERFLGTANLKLSVANSVSKADQN